MSKNRKFTIQSKIIIAIIFIVLAFGGCLAINKMIKEIQIATMEEPK